MGILCDLIVSAKDKNKDSLMEIINKFRPLINKQVAVITVIFLKNFFRELPIGRFIVSIGA